MRRIVNSLERWNCRGTLFKNPLVIRVKIEGVVSFNDFNFSVLKLIKKNPILKAKIVSDENNRFWFDTENAPDCSIKFISKKENDDWIRLIENIFNTQFNFSDNPITTFILMNDSKFSDIIVITEHSIIDGMGFIYLINELLILISNPNLEVEEGKFPLPIEDLIPEPLKLNQNLKDIKIQLLNKEKYKNLFHRPTSIQIINIEKENVNKLINLGKKVGATIHSILSSFFLVSFAKTFSERNLSRIGAISPANLRPYLAREFHESIGMYSIPGIDISFKYSIIKEINALDDFLKFVKKFNQKLKSRYEVNMLFGFILVLMNNFYRIDDLGIKNVVDKNAEIGFAFSNLGVFPFDLRYGDYKLLELNEIVDPTYPSLEFMICSLQDKMAISILFKSEVFNKEDITQLMNNFFKTFEFLKKE